MNPVTIVGMVLGALVILTALGIFWTKKDFPAPGLGAIVVGLILVGMSQWSSITFKGMGLEFQALRARMDSVATTAAEVANQAGNAAAAVEVARQQLNVLTTQLESRNVVSPQALEGIRRAMANAPHPDTASLRTATDRLRKLTRERIPPP